MGQEVERTGTVALSRLPLRPPPRPPDTPVCVAIDILDEDHSLRLAMRRLATDAALRDAARARRRASGGARSIRSTRWSRTTSASCAEAAARPDAARCELPAHLRDAGDRKLAALLAPLRRRGQPVTITLNGDPSTARRTAHRRRPARAARDRSARVAVERNFVVVKRDAYATTADRRRATRSRSSTSSAEASDRESESNRICSWIRLVIAGREFASRLIIGTASIRPTRSCSRRTTRPAPTW